MRTTSAAKAHDGRDMRVLLACGVCVGREVERREARKEVKLDGTGGMLVLGLDLCLGRW